MNFRTELVPARSPLQIGYSHRMLSMGSCFADRMGDKLTQAKFRTLVNPLGIAYNPISLGHLLQVLIGEKELSPAIFSDKEDIWQSFDFHSRFNQPSREEFERGIHSAITKAQRWLQQTDVLILTFGTAIGFRRKDTGQLVNNCHRFPASLFDRELLELSMLVAEVSQVLSQLFSAFPALQVLLTLSPVRHIKDSLQLNSASKASLRLLCHQLSNSFGQVFYFPSFELMMDDLRDYRFYKEDMIHPSHFAETYIWESFVRTHVDADSQLLLKRWEQIRRDLQHRPRQPHSEGHQRFLAALLQKLEGVAEVMDCEEEVEWVRRQMG
ncbi:MAG: GSCFA domain-containing protein [Bacteroidota bacterium]